MSEDLNKAIGNLITWVPASVTACHGTKCREPNCESCYGYEDASQAIAEGVSAVRAAKDALAHHAAEIERLRAHLDSIIEAHHDALGRDSESLYVEFVAFEINRAIEDLAATSGT